MSQCKLGLSLALALVALVPFHLRADGPSIAQQRIKLTKDYNDGNWAIAYNGLRKLALDPNNEPLLISRDFELAVAALDRLGRNEEIDDFRETVVKVHAKNWRLLASAAKSLADGSHGGIIVAGSFKRGHGFVSSTARDRVRALQLLHQAIALSADDKDRLTRAELHLQCAGQLLYGAWFSDAWHLQYLTDLTKFPDYEQSNGWQRAGTNHRGAPVDEAGNPVLHYVPKTYADAKTDGERWRWMLARAIELDPSRASQVDLFFADFMQGQLGVQTLTDHGWSFAQVLDRPLDKSSVSALHTLKDDETIANLATGVKRFRIPAEFNWLKIYQRVADRARARDVWAERALDSIAQEFEDRRQYPRAAEVWKVVIKEYGAGHDAWRKHRMEQIVGNWGQFETTTAQTAGQPASLDFRFRNGKKLALEAHAIDVPKFLADVKAYIASKPANGVDDNRVDTSGLGRRLTDIKGEEKKYSLGKVAEWSIDLKPRPNHFDEQVSIKTPLTKPGAYLVKARVADGNLSQILAWISDTIIVKTEMKGETLYYVADAVTGAPIADATVDFFGWYQEQVPNSRIYKVFTTSFKKKTNKDGLVAVLDSPHSNWLVTAVKAKDGPGGADRFAFLGPTRFWNAAPYDTKYEETRTLVITDRPVYRPEHKVHFKVWVQQPRYEKPNASEYAGSKFNVIISDPLGNKVSQQPLKADKFGGIAGEYRLPKDAPLGAYDVVVRDEANDGSFGGSTFRVEEYKKPEFEVKVNAPTDPVKLGDKFTASVEAKYLFGAPVVGAVVKYKVLRTPYTAQWFPAGPWDWLYGRGYGWLSSGFTWYPGFDPWAWNLAGLDAWGGVQQQPEIVSENEVRIGPGGKLDIVIDTSAAKSLHPNQDHQYSIMAEVTDASRRTIVGTGGVAVARQPFQVHVWLDRGHYRVGDTIEASCVAHTLDSQPIISEPHDRGGRARRLEAAAIFIDPADAVLAPVKGNGTMTLYRISYNAKNEPVETQVEKWDIATNADGEAGQRFKVQKPGQYRLSCKVDDAKKNTIEGSYFFLVAGEGFDGKGLRFNDIEIVPDKRTYAPGDKVKLNINVNKSGATVLLFVRPRNGYYPTPKMLHLKGKSIVEEIEVVDADMPNFFVEAFTIADGRVHSAVREIIVPPAQRVVNVEVLPAQKEYRPGQKAVVKVKLSQLDGKPFQGAAVVSVYDKSVEYISGGTNVPEIKAFFWQWVRSHHTALYSSVIDYSGNLVADRVMEDIGMFGSERILPRGRWYEGPREVQEEVQMLLSPLSSNRGMGMVGMAGMMMGGMPGMMMGGMGGMAAFPVPAGMIGAGPPPDPNMNADPMSNPWPAPPLRKNFADTAYWNANLVPNKDGIAELSFTAPDQLTTWKIHAWAMGLGTRVGEGAAEVVTKKDLIVRLQAPRFFVQKDEVVLSANVHNYLQADKKIRVSLELDGGTLSAIDPLTRMIEIVAGGEQRVDWRVKAVREGDAIIRMKAVCDVDADAMEMRFPVFVHGMLKTDSYTGVIRPGKNS
ncbi:MAG TPA: MG2 domain-containing protein, partial [Gemmataceae bacterium]|nr:MG2 domain-containing protein [Gemmataceae bacterium]